MKVSAAVVGVLLLASVVGTGCGKKAEDGEAAGSAGKANAPIVVPANVPPEAKAQIQQGIQHGQADGAAYAAQQKAHAAQQGSK